MIFVLLNWNTEFADKFLQVTTSTKDAQSTRRIFTNPRCDLRASVVRLVTLFRFHFFKSSVATTPVKGKVAAKINVNGTSFTIA